MTKFQNTDNWPGQNNGLEGWKWQLLEDSLAVSHSHQRTCSYLGFYLKWVEHLELHNNLHMDIYTQLPEFGSNQDVL